MRTGINSRKRLLDYLEREGYLRTSKVRNAMEEVNRANFVRTSDKYLGSSATLLDKAIDLFENLTNKYPKTARGFHLKAFAYTRKENYEKALESIKSLWKASEIIKNDCKSFINH